MPMRLDESKLVRNTQVTDLRVYVYISMIKNEILFVRSARCQDIHISEHAYNEV